MATEAGYIAPYQLASIEQLILQLNGQPRSLTSSEANVVHVYAQGATEEIAASWPVDTGNSRDQWMFFVGNSPGAISFTIQNLVDYVPFVHYPGDPTELVDTLVPDIIDRWIDRMLPALRAEVEQTQRDIAANLAQGGKGYLDVRRRKPLRSLSDLIDAVLGG